MKLISGYLRALRKSHVSLYLTDSGGAIKATGLFPKLNIEWGGAIGYEGPALHVHEAADLKDALELVERVGCDAALPALKSADMQEYQDDIHLDGDGYELPAIAWAPIVLGCVSNDDIRPNLCAPFVCYTRHAAYVVGTDGYSLAAVCDRPDFVHHVDEPELEAHIPLDIICSDKNSVICESVVTEKGGYVVLFSGCGTTVRISWTAPRETPPKWAAVLPAPTESFDFDVLCSKPPKQASKKTTRVGLLYGDDGVPANVLVYFDDEEDIIAAIDHDGILVPGPLQVTTSLQGSILGNLHKLISKSIKSDVYIDVPSGPNAPVAINHSDGEQSLLVLAVPLRGSARDLELLQAHLG